jgi:hypothetical protein
MDSVGTVRIRDWNDGTYTVYVKRDENLWAAVYIDGVDGLGHPPFDANGADVKLGKLVFYRGHRAASSS